MKGFLIGFASAAALAALGYLLLLRGADPCTACGPGTRCQDQHCVAESRTEPTPSAKKRPRHAAKAAPEEGGDEHAVALKPADLKPVTAGDNLNATEVIDLTTAHDEGRELTQDDLDAVFRREQGAILSCFDQARGEAPLSGKVTVSFRVQRSGAVSGVRVEAPAYLMQHGLYGCIRPIVGHMRFPASGRGQVVSYPFTLR